MNRPAKCRTCLCGEPCDALERAAEDARDGSDFTDREREAMADRAQTRWERNR